MSSDKKIRNVVGHNVTLHVFHNYKSKTVDAFNNVLLLLSKSKFESKHVLEWNPQGSSNDRVPEGHGRSINIDDNEFILTSG